MCVCVCVCMYVCVCVLTPQIFSDAKSKPVFGPLYNAGVVKHHAGQNYSLPDHHRLIRRLLRKPRAAEHWQTERDKNVLICYCTLYMGHCSFFPTFMRIFFGVPYIFVKYF